MAAKIGLGTGAPLVVTVVWAMLVSLLLEVTVFGIGAAALVAAGHRTLVWVFVA